MANMKLVGSDGFRARIYMESYEAHEGLVLKLYDESPPDFKLYVIERIERGYRLEHDGRGTYYSGTSNEFTLYVSPVVVDP